MAEKSFGVKEVNLIGASGTPTITSPNNLNLNAVNVAISTNATVGGTLSVTGNVSVGGTLTYEDVTNIDSVGIVTAREGIFIPDSKELKIGNTAGSADLKLYHDASDSHIANTTGVFFIQNTGDLRIRVDNTDAAIHCVRNGAVELHHAGTKKLETSSSGATVTGTLSATTFSGSGASLTSLPAANLTGTLPAISGANLTGITITPTNSDIQVVYTVTANGASAYRFAGNGVVSTADNPDLYFIRGKKYRFINNSGGSHPFQIREASGGTAYSTGVTNNGAASGNIDFAPTFDSPAQLVYQCTSHGGMVGNIYLRGGNGNENNVGVITATNGGTSGLTMADHWRLTVGQTITTQDVVLTSWARPNTSGTGGGAYVGGGMSNSSGTFSFPTTGIYLITFHASFNGTNNTRYSEIDIVVTKNNSTYVEAARSFFYFNRPTGTSTGASASCNFIMDVDNISNDKVRFESSQDNVGQHQVLGDTGNATLTTVTFLRLGDT